MAAETGVEDRRAVIARTVLAAAETLLQTTELEAAGMPVFEALRDLIGVQDARLWLYDPTQHVLRDTASAEIEMSAVTGVTSYAARTARPVLAEAFETDRRYDAEVDGSGGHLLAVPVAGPEDQVLGVLAMRRESPAFGPEDLEIGQRLASHLAPILSLYAPQVLEHALQTGTQGSDAELFRREALEAQARGFSERGRILQNTRGWTEWTWRLLLSGFLAALLFTVIGRMHDYAAGPAVVRIGQRIDVTAPVGAPVTSVEVRALQQVRAGDPLVRLFGAPQASQIANLEAEFEQRLRRRLAQPADTLIEASLIDVRTRLEEAKARLDERTVRSPIDGVVGDVRVRPGQHPVIGEVLMSVVADSEKRTVIGLMPGHFKPQLESEQRLRLTLQGYPDLALELRVEQVGEEVIAADEALQVLGRTIAPAVQSSGPVVVVEAGLSEASFSDGRNTLAFSDGMQGTAEIRVRSRPLLFHLIPGLDRALRGLEGAGDE
ncbi:MAG: GAF domain-containing protein, partial [Acidobacteriota bacterium]